MSSNGIIKYDVIMERLFWSLMLITIAVITTLFSFYLLNQYFPLVILSFECGLAGSILAIGVSLNKMKESHLQLLVNSRNSLITVIISGGVFAILINALFVFSTLPVFAFPQFIGPVNLTATNPEINLFFANTNPADLTQISKVIVWSFIAGNCAKYVPNLLEYISSRKYDFQWHH